MCFQIPCNCLDYLHGMPKSIFWKKKIRYKNISNCCMLISTQHAIKRLTGVTEQIRWFPKKTYIITCANRDQYRSLHSRFFFFFFSFFFFLRYFYIIYFRENTYFGWISGEALLMSTHSVYFLRSSYKIKSWMLCENLLSRVMYHVSVLLGASHEKLPV